MKAPPESVELTDATVIEYRAATSMYFVRYEEVTVDEDGIEHRQNVQLEVPARRVEDSVLDVLQYFCDRRKSLDDWYQAAMIVVLFQPSSCAAERVFSMLEQCYSKKGNRGRSLADLVVATIKLRKHNREV